MALPNAFCRDVRFPPQGMIGDADWRKRVCAQDFPDRVIETGFALPAHAARSRDRLYLELRDSGYRAGTSVEVGDS
jgi:hypothetical protein